MGKLEFSILGHKDTNLIKIVAHERNNKMYLELLTKQIGLGMDVSHIVELSNDDLLEIIKKYSLTG